MKKLLALFLAIAAPACGDKGGHDQDTTADTDLDQDGDSADTGSESDATDVPADADAESEATGLVLDLGDVETLEGVDGVFDVLIEAPAGGGRYALILFASAAVEGATYGYDVSATGDVSAPPPPPPPDAAPAPAEPLAREWIASHGGAPLLDWQKLQASLGGERHEIWETWPDDPPPTVDEVRQFTIQDGSYVLHPIDAECQFVDDEIAIWFDVTSTPATTVSNQDEIASLYRDIVMPRLRQMYGEESDLNGDGVVFFLFSPLVADIGASAYFYPCDLIEDPSPSSGCSYGNHAEMLYACPPNLLPSYMGTPEAIVETMSHESAHMIYFNRKFLLNDQALAFENVYLNEGLAALAQDLTGMAAGNFFVTQAGLEEIEDFSGLDILSSMGGYDPALDGMLRGVVYLFQRYLYDMHGGDVSETDGSITDAGSIAWLLSYVGDPELGIANISAHMDDREVREIMFDFVTALMLSNRGPASAPISPDPAFNFLPTQTDPLTDRVRGADMFGSFHDMFSLTGPAYATIASNDGTVDSVGVQYIVFDASGPAGITLDVAPEAAAWVRLARIQ